MQPGSAFRRAQARTEFERARQALRNALDGDPFETSRRFSDLTASLDSGVTPLKPELIGSSLSWNDDQRRFSAWIHQQHQEMGELGRRIADFFSRSLGPADARTLRLAALTLFHWGESVKWSLDHAGRRDYAWAHWLFALALDTRRHVEPGKLWAEARARTVTIENLYFRALLLDRFAGGNLTRRQLEVLDAWLWDWAPDLVGHASFPGGAVLRADLDSGTGLQQGRRADVGRSLYLALAPLEARRRGVIADFHRGRIVPATGCAADFRIEEHVEVLESLRRVFSAPDAACARRSPRIAAAGSRVDVWTGLAEIVDNAFGGGSEAPRRRWTLCDTSDDGYGFELSDEEADGIGVGDLVATRVVAGRCVLGRVVRRLSAATEGRVAIGVERLSDEARAVVLSPRGAPEGEAGETFLFVPGDDASGRHDAFVVPERLLPDSHARVVRAGSQAFALRFNRVRSRGRGWALAGFEIDVDAAMADAPRAAAPAASAEDTALDRAWDRELSPRLM